MKKTSRLAYILQEILIVVVGVLIAVSIGNYKEQSDNEKYIEKTLTAIKSEIELSRQATDSALVRHYALAEGMEELIDNEEQTLGEMVSSLGGVQFPQIKNVSLRFFVANKAELIDFQIIAQLLDIEEQSVILKAKLDRLADFAYEHITESNLETKISFAYMLSDVIDSEESILEAYEEFASGNQEVLEEED